MKYGIGIRALYGLFVYVVTVIILGGIDVVLPFMPYNSILATGGILGLITFLVSAMRHQ